MTSIHVIKFDNKQDFVDITQSYINRHNITVAGGAVVAPFVLSSIRVADSGKSVMIRYQLIIDGTPLPYIYDQVIDIMLPVFEHLGLTLQTQEIKNPLGELAKAKGLDINQFAAFDGGTLKTGAELLEPFHVMHIAEQSLEKLESFIHELYKNRTHIASPTVNGTPITKGAYVAITLPFGADVVKFGQIGTRHVGD